ncbi:MAG TPA: MarR family transcriptional regulator [Gaiellaceae bacterium]|nr:MarR family transcriptional regulator [Gaiellaceae bacterium]
MAVEPEPFGPPLIGALLRNPWEAVQRHMLERLHEHGFQDFDAAYLPVFGYPGPQGARPSELAGRLRMSKQALNYLLGRLERSGYLERQPHPDDLRSKRIALTPRGVAAVKVIRDAVSEIEDSWAELLGSKRFSQLRKLLQDLGRLAQPPPEGGGGPNGALLP